MSVIDPRCAGGECARGIAADGGLVYSGGCPNVSGNLQSLIMPLKGIMKEVAPGSARRWLKDRRFYLERLRLSLGFWAGPGLLRRITPINPNDYGESRGQCIDRYYIERFLAEHADDVRGHVLDFADDVYARRFGGDKTTKIDVLHRTADNPKATIVADLSCGENIPSDTFDCIVCTQVLHCIFEVEAAVRTLFRALKPGGVVLVTDAGIQKLDSVDMTNGEEYWRFTSLALRRLFEEVFPKDHVEVKAYGNALAAVAFLHGLAVEDLKRDHLDYFDRDFEVSLALRAVKPKEPSAR
jgi:SAM-dependent methyltransferase